MACGGLPIGSTTFLVTTTTADSTLGLNVGSPVTGKSYHITDMVVSSDTEMTISMTESDNDPVMDAMYFPKQAIWSKTWCTSIVLHPTTNLVVTGSAAGNVSVIITGYLK